MDKEQKKKIVMKEIEKVHKLGENIGAEHVSNSTITKIWIGNGENSSQFNFSAEVERESEFGRRLFWYYGTIMIRNNRVSTEIKSQKGSGINIFMLPKDKEKKMEKTVLQIRKKLHLGET